MRLRRLLPLALLALAGPAAAQDALAGQLSVHGYLTQAWARSAGARHYGMTDDGSTDFRYAALQLRYDREKHGVLLQLNHRRLGTSPITDTESDVTLNWAFYEHRFAETGSVRVGRVPVPRGIYNEQRSIGVLLPFYRAPVIFYDEGAYFSETVDGAVASYRIDRPSGWGLEANLYAGGWSPLIYNAASENGEYRVGRSQARDGLGTQLWVHAPVEGLRLGLAVQRYGWEIPPEVYGEEASVRYVVREVQGSFDLTRARGFVRAEATLQAYAEDDYVATYAEVGVRATPRLLLVALHERAWDTNQTYAPDWPSTYDWHRSTALGVNYAFTSALVGKLEHHWDRGVQVEQPVEHPDRAPRFRYLIASLSASF